MMMVVSAALVVTFRLIAIIVTVPGHFGMGGVLIRTILSPTGQAQ